MLKKLNIFSLLLLLSITAQSQTASFDNTFGVKGIKTQKGEGVTLFGDLQMDIANDGKIVFLENGNNSLDTPIFFIKKLLSNGTNDNSFGNQGSIKVQEKSFGLGIFYITTIKITTDAKVLLCGVSGENANGNGKITVVRLNANGTLDTSFGTNGVALYGDGSVSLFPYGMSIQSDGKILVSVNQGGTDAYALVRFLSNGKIDTTFGSNGLATYKISEALIQSSFITQLETDAQGNVYVLGSYVGDQLKKVVAVCKFNNAGTVVSTFGKSGIAKVTANENTTEAFGLGIQTDGKIVVSTREYDSDDDYIQENAVYRLNTAGVLDATYGTSGKIAFFSYKAGDTYYKVLADTKLMSGNNKLIAGAYAYNDDNAEASIIFSRFNINGTKDMTFGVGGELTYVQDSLTYYTGSLAIQRNNNNLVMFNQAENSDGGLFFQFSKVLNPFGVATRDWNEVSDFKVYPTIATSAINVAYELTQPQNIHVSLYNVEGVKVAEMYDNNTTNIGKQQHTFSLPSSLAPGVYFLTMSNNNEQFITKKFIKQ